VSSFQIEGQLLGVEFKRQQQQQIKHIQIRTACGEVRIKVAKSLRHRLSDQSLELGTTLEICGQQTKDPSTGKTRFKAKKLRLKCPSLPTDIGSPIMPVVEQSATILICRKCQEKSVCQALAAELADRNLTDRVTTEFTGCIKRCESAPNLIVITSQKTPQGQMSGKTPKTKTHHGKVKRRQIPALLDRHGLSKSIV
jgi:(2Fe-2S) ferredoxin